MITLTRHGRGFTLIELLVAMSIGLIIMNVAFTALHFTRKFVKKGEIIGAKNEIVQSCMLWKISKGTISGYPNNIPQFRLMGADFTGSATTSTSVVPEIFSTVILKDYSKCSHANDASPNDCKGVNAGENSSGIVRCSVDSSHTCGLNSGVVYVR